MKSNHVFAFILIVIGMIFLLDSLEIIAGISKMWPIFVFLLGLGFLMLFYPEKNKKRNALQLGIATGLILLSILFFYLNFTAWVKLAKLWPIFLIIVGLSIGICYFTLKRVIFLYTGLILIMLGIVFYLVFAISTRLWPVSLMLVGLSFIFLEDVKK